METTSFRVKRKIGDISKGVGNRSGSQYQSRVEKYKKARYAIGNVSMKEFSNKIKEFEKIVKVPYLKRYLDNFSNSLVLLERSFILTFPIAYLAFLYFFDLALVLRARAVTNPFPDLSNSTFNSEDVVSILFRLSNFSEIFKI